MKFKNDIEAQAGFKDAGGDLGTAGQLLSSTGTETNWIDQSTIASGSSETIDIQVKNISSANGGVNLSKGDPVYIYGSVGASARLYVDLADADSTATNNLGDSKMPCVALLDQDLAPNIEGTATVVGKLRNLITSPIDGRASSENDTVYVKSGGGLTLTKPTGSTNLIQNVGQVGRVSTSNDGNIVVAALLRTNDVPNLPEGRLFVGTSANTSLASDVVYVDDTNDRVGIGIDDPKFKLNLYGDGSSSNGIVSTGSYDFGGFKIGQGYNPSGNTSSNITSKIEFLNTAPIGYYGDDILFSTTLHTFNLADSDASLERMRITHDGYVGIGTDNPVAELDVVGTIEADKVKVPSYISSSGFVLKGISDGSNIKFDNAAVVGTGNAFIQTISNHLGLGKTIGHSTSNININLTNGYLGVKQKNPLAPLHVKTNGEAIRLESSGDNVCSIDFTQGGNKRGHIQFDNSSDTIEIKTTNPTGSLSKIKFSVASGVGQEGTEVMRVQKNQVVIGNPVSANSDKELYIDGAIETTGFLNVFSGSLSVGGRVDADSYKLKGLNTAPTSSIAPGAVGEIRFTAGYIYVCIATDRWRRAALTDW